MNPPVYILELSRASWRILCEGSEAEYAEASGQFEERDLAAQAKTIREALTSAGYAGEPIVLALDSSWCLSTTLTGLSSQELRDRKSLSYRLEEWIPWAEEDFVADYIQCEKSTLVIAAPLPLLSEFVAELESAGLDVESIVPLALLTVTAHVRSQAWPLRHVVAWQRDESIDLILVEQSDPAAWSWFPAQATMFRQELTRLLFDSPEPTLLVAYGLDDKLVGGIEDWKSKLPVDVKTQTAQTPDSLALTAARLAVQGKLDLPIDLKRGQLGHSRGHVALRPYVATLRAAIALVFVAVVATLLYRGYSLSRQADLVVAQQADVFHRVLPNHKLPIGVRSRLESELAKLKGLHGSEANLPPAVSVSTVLKQLLESMPSDRRFRLLEIRIEEGRLYLDGEVRRHSDAELIAQRLRAQGFQIPAPRTQMLDAKRVSFRITGEYTGRPVAPALEQTS